jgi:hypothetical protein
LSCCADHDQSDTYLYSVLPVESYEFPASFKLGETYEIKLKYQKPSSCHQFQGIYFSSNLNSRTVGIQTALKENQACTKELPPLSETSFNFFVTNNGSYIFKMYKGKVDGKDVFEDVEIQVEK